MPPQATCYCGGAILQLAKDYKNPGEAFSVVWVFGKDAHGPSVYFIRIGTSLPHDMFNERGSFHIERLFIGKELCA